jgi:RNA polymerase sigma-70 factor, ECF subfamily
VDGLGIDPLLLGLAAGDGRAFAILYDRYGVRLYRAALRMLGSREDAEDAVQDVFLSVVRSHRSLDDVRDLTAYLFTSLRRAAGRCAQRRVRATHVSSAVAEEAIAPVDCSSLDDPNWHRLQRAIGSLPEEQREVLTLKIDGELTFSQIAQVVGVSISTAASRYHYALKKLRTSLVGNREVCLPIARGVKATVIAEKPLP